MQKTPDQILDELEFRRAEISVARKRRLLARIGDVTQLLGPVALLVFAGYWLKGIASWPPPYLIIVWFVGFGLTVLSRRWSLEDRVEALEQMLKKL